jgi:hypothetical protein
MARRGRLDAWAAPDAKKAGYAYVVLDGAVLSGVTVRPIPWDSAPARAWA